MDRWSILKQEIVIFSSHGALLFYSQNVHQLNVQISFINNSSLSSVYIVLWYIKRVDIGQIKLPQ